MRGACEFAKAFACAAQVLAGPLAASLRLELIFLELVRCTAHLGLSSGSKEPLPPGRGPHVAISIRKTEHTPKETLPETAQVTGGHRAAPSWELKVPAPLHLPFSLCGQRTWGGPTPPQISSSLSLQPLLGFVLSAQHGNVQKPPRGGGGGYFHQPQMPPPPPLPASVSSSLFNCKEFILWEKNSNL